MDSILEVGRLLAKAKSALPHGEWQCLFDRGLVPFSLNTAQRLMKVAEHPQLSKAAHVQLLPPSWGTLYELTKADSAKLKAAFKDGSIKPDMKRRDVQALLPPTKRSSRRHPLRSTSASPDSIGYRTAGSHLYFQIARLLSDEFDTLSTEDQDDVLNMLEQTLAELRTNRLEKAVQA